MIDRERYESKNVWLGNNYEILKEEMKFKNNEIDDECAMMKEKF